MIVPGELPHRITIKREPDTQSVNEFGEPIPDPETVLENIAARVDELQGRELVAAQAVNQDAAFKVKIRYRAGLTGACWVEWGTRRLELTAPAQNEDGRKVWLTLYCSERQS